MPRSLFARTALLSTIAAIGIAVAACSGSGGSSNTLPHPTTAPSSGASPSSAPTTAPTVAPSVAPTVAPTVAPSVPPTVPPSTGPSVIQFSPNPVELSPFGAPCTNRIANFVASEAGYTGMFTAVSTNPTEATVAPSQSTGTFTVTQGTGVTTVTPAFITVSDTHGNSAMEPITFNTCVLP